MTKEKKELWAVEDFAEDFKRQVRENDFRQFRIDDYIYTPWESGSPDTSTYRPCMIMIFPPNTEIKKGNEICCYRDPDMLAEHHRFPGSPQHLSKENIEDMRPSDPYKVRADVDNYMYFYDTGGRLYVYSEDEATRWARAYAHYCELALKKDINPAVDKKSDPKVRKLWEKYDGNRWVAWYKTYEYYVEFHSIALDYRAEKPLWIHKEWGDDYWELL